MKNKWKSVNKFYKIVKSCKTLEHLKVADNFLDQMELEGFFNSSIWVGERLKNIELSDELEGILNDKYMEVMSKKIEVCCGKKMSSK